MKIYQSVIFILKLLCIFMYIDSPNFPRRKVVSDRSQPVGSFGLQRLQLANFVTDQLNNNHKDDAQILQKFRKQASQYKHNLLHRKFQQPTLSSQPTLQPQLSFEPQAKSPNLMVTTKLNDINNNLERIHTSNSDENMPNQHNKNNQKVVFKEIVRVVDEEARTGNIELVRMLERKDKELSRQAKLIKRNQQKIHDLKKRVHRMEYENRIRQAERLAALQQNSYERIKGFISSMSNRLAQNQSLLANNFSQITPNRKPSLQELPSQPSPRKPKHKSQVFIPAQASNPEPRISYNYKVINEQNINKNKSGINNINFMIDSLGSSRNRLDHLGSFV